MPQNIGGVVKPGRELGNRAGEEEDIEYEDEGKASRFCPGEDRRGANVLGGIS